MSYGRTNVFLSSEAKAGLDRMDVAILGLLQNNARLSVKEIAALQSTLRKYIYEAIEIEESGKKVQLKKPSEYPIPEELQTRLEVDSTLKSAFEALTPGRRKSYILHISAAKQSTTRAARAEKCTPMILNGRGFNERPNR